VKALAHRQRNRHTCRHTYEYGGARGLRNNSPAGRPKRASEIWEAAVRKETAPRDDTENQTTKPSIPVRRRGATARGSKRSVRRIHRTTVANGKFRRRRGGTKVPDDEAARRERDGGHQLYAAASDAREGDASPEQRPDRRVAIRQAAKPSRTAERRVTAARRSSRISGARRRAERPKT
jgi:hypothetical protein